MTETEKLRGLVEQLNAERVTPRDQFERERMDREYAERLVRISAQAVLALEEQLNRSAVLKSFTRPTEPRAAELEQLYGEWVCRGCLLPWSAAHHGDCTGRALARSGDFERGFRLGRHGGRTANGAELSDPMFAAGYTLGGGRVW